MPLFCMRGSESPLTVASLSQLSVLRWDIALRSELECRYGCIDSMLVLYMLVVGLCSEIQVCGVLFIYSGGGFAFLLQHSPALIICWVSNLNQKVMAVTGPQDGAMLRAPGPSDGVWR